MLAQFFAHGSVGYPLEYATEIRSHVLSGWIAVDVIIASPDKDGVDFRQETWLALDGTACRWLQT